MGDHVIEEILAHVLEQRHGFERQPAPVPGKAEAPRHAADLSAADRQAIVVELLPEPDRIGALLVEGEVDHGALRPQGPERGLQAARVGAGLEHDIGAAVAGAVVPARLGKLDRRLLGRRLEPQRFDLLASKRGGVGHHDFGRAAASRK